MKRYHGYDVHENELGGLLLASDVDAALAAKDATIALLKEGNRILRDELNKDESVMESDVARIAQLESVLREAQDFLSDIRWGKWSYMEGSEIYTDRDAVLGAINAVLSDAKAALGD